MYFTPHYSHFVILVFLGTAAVLGAAALGAVAALAARRLPLFKGIVTIAALLGGLYLGVMLAVSAGSNDQVLAAGQTKYFCEADCHLAYSLTSVTTAKTLGDGASTVTAHGVFYVVSLRSWFDAETTSKSRPADAQLWPNPRLIYAFDDAGQRYATSLAGQKAVIASTVPLTQPLRPGESYETVLVFDLPANTKSPRLLVQDGSPLSPLLIGHENSLGHKKAYFAMTPAAGANSAKM